MAIVAVAGDLTTTTSIALASAWPISDDAIVIEADPTGGDLAAWFDMPVSPSLSTVVTRVLDGAWPEIERHTRLSDSGIRLIPAPTRAGEASQAIGESARSVVSTLATLRSPVVIADTGRLQLSPAAHPVRRGCSDHHRRAPPGAPVGSRCGAVRLQRLADQLDAFSAIPTALVVAVVGATPFDLGEIESFLAESVGERPDRRACRSMISRPQCSAVEPACRLAGSRAFRSFERRVTSQPPSYGPGSRPSTVPRRMPR